VAKVLLIDPLGASYGLSPALAYIGAFLKSKGMDCRGLDLNNLHVSVADETMKRTVLEFKPDIIGYSVLYTSYRWLQEHLRGIRLYFSGSVVVGGPKVILEGRDIFRDMPEVDIACVSEGEYVLWEIAKCLENGDPLDHVKGIIFRHRGELVETPGRPPLGNLNELPFPDFQIFNSHRLPYYPLITSRGCPFRCKYCFRSFKGDWRPRSPANIIAEIEHATTTYVFKHMVIHDDSFNLNLNRVLEMCDLMIERGIKIPWKCAGIRANLVNDTICNRMKAAGCTEVAVGIESLVPDVFAGIDKMESLDSIFEGVRLMRRNGLNVAGYFIIGLPGDTFRKTMETFRKATDIVDSQSWTLLLPIKGTPLWDELHRDPNVRWLYDYRDIDMTWLPRLSEVKTAFETKEYPADQKLFAYHKINIHLGTPKYKVYSSRLRTLIGILCLILKHAPLKGLMHICLALPRSWRKLLSGRIPLSRDDLLLVHDQ